MKANIQKLPHNQSPICNQNGCPILLSKGNLVVVGKNPPGKYSHEIGDASILDLNHKNGVLCQFVLGREKGCFTTKNPAREEYWYNQQATSMHKAWLSSLFFTQHSYNRLNNAAEKGDLAPQFALSIKNWLNQRSRMKKDKMAKHPVIAYLKEGRKSCHSVTHLVDPIHGWNWNTK